MGAHQCKVHAKVGEASKTCLSSDTRGRLKWDTGAQITMFHSDIKRDDAYTTGLVMVGSIAGTKQAEVTILLGEHRTKFKLAVDYSIGANALLGRTCLD